MGIFLCFFLLCIVVFLILGDILKKIRLMGLLPLTVLFLFGGNALFWGYHLYSAAQGSISSSATVTVLVILGIFIFYMFARLHFLPLPVDPEAGIRLTIMIAGRFLVYRGIYALFLELIFLLLTFFPALRSDMPKGILIANTVLGILTPLFILSNGGFRLFFTSRRLSILRRVLILATMWIPLVNLLILGYAGHIANMEYDFALYKKDLEKTRTESDLCRTKYPLLLVHGVLFRDLKYFNYWGRIPKALKKQGAQVYYGHQEAAGSIEANATQLSQAIRRICEENGCDKVNLIAHSKGGLDARYAISCLGMESNVASLTSINVPHRGSRIVDTACKLPEGLYRAIAKIGNWAFRKIGDENPDFYLATREVAEANCERFNRTVPDSPHVFYQSYMSVMKNCLSDSLLCIPHLILSSASKGTDRRNDGLVTVSSSAWGHSRALFSVKSRRGISHGDIIDLKREDYKGFDVRETYVAIVSDLKKMGF